MQTGYLTIKNFDGTLYQLDFPNYEVKRSFFDAIVSRFTSIEGGLSQGYIVKLGRQLKANNLENFFEIISKFFANIPYTITLKHEKYYQSLFYTIFTLLGFELDVEVTTNKGRIDCVLQTEKTLYLLEFKLNGTKEQALEQIKDKQYYQRFLDEKEIYLVGIEFDQEQRNIGGWIKEAV